MSSKETKAEAIKRKKRWLKRQARIKEAARMARGQERTRRWLNGGSEAL